MGYHANVRGRFAIVLVVCGCLAGCDRKDPEPPDTGDPSGDVRVSPGDRLAWTQRAPETSDIAALQFILYVDGARTPLTGAGCTQSFDAFDCSAVLPSLSAGMHTLELSAFVTDGGLSLESARSPALSVVVAAQAGSSPFSASSIDVVTVEQEKLTLARVVDGLEMPSDLAFSPDGSIFVAERPGTVRRVQDGSLVGEPALDISRELTLPAGGLLAIALDPKFAGNGFMYTLYAAAAPRNGQEFTLARFRGVNGTFAERAVLLDRTPASAYSASGALRIGGDGTLYVALDSSSDSSAAGSFATYNGKILRLDTDATTPDDQAGQPPIFSFDHPQPQAMDWQPATGHLWAVDRMEAGAGRLSVISNDPKQKRAASRPSYALPAGTGAASAAFYRGALMPFFRDNLFVAAEAGRELIRLGFDPDDSSRIVSVERLLKDQIGPVGVVAEGKDGALYIATDSALYRLAP